jgi:hypothetical protein
MKSTGHFGRPDHRPSARKRSGQRRDRKHWNIGPSSIKKTNKMDWYTETATPHQGAARDERS